MADLLGRKWMQGWVPVVTLLVALVWALIVDPYLLNAQNINDIGFDLAITGFLGLGLALTVLAGGIDISVVGTYALSSVVSLVLAQQGILSPPLALVAALVVGAAIGAVNGFLVVGLGMRPLLTTLVVLVSLRSVLTIVSDSANRSLETRAIDDPTWAFFEAGTVVGLKVPVLLFLVVALVLHLVQTRTRLGSHFVATGASERASREAGIATKRVKFTSYLVAGLLASIAGIFFAARVGAVSDQIGGGQEFALLATLLLAGVSLAGGVGTVPRLLVATLAVAVLGRTLINQGADANIYGVLIALLLLAAVTIDAKFLKHRGRVLEKLEVAPTAVELSGALPDFDVGSGSFWALNDKLASAGRIGLGVVEGPEDCAVDREGRVYCGDRRGWVWRFSGVDYEHAELFSRPGGGPLGLVFDLEGNLILCSAGRGLVSIDPAGIATTLTDRTRRSLFSIVDDRRLRLVDDLDVSPDGRIWFSEATKRFDQEKWMFDTLESRPNGRLLCYDPATKKTTTVLKELFFPNGVCSTHEGDSVLVVSTSRANVKRYYHSGPKRGQLEMFIDGLPGYPDNINRASDGGYWIGFVGVRNPAFDLAMKDVGFKRRMVHELPVDDWMFPNFNQGCLVKLSSTGELVECFWDKGMTEHSMVTSMREFDGRLFIGGLTNNRVGYIPVPTGTCDCGQTPCGGGQAVSVSTERVQEVIR
ncbi:ABC transporter permease [Cryobacterium sp. TMS1-20-1]|uniref:ABC transporter permease n=1 Tax=Cryobacterium sp. TMS1-20-1 TaxID=1259223 RepID=UPI00106C546C|nr:SMP-30/gluconolactonase/LRE family protein [Cryobacterium sp. TMS1-20-1]TFC80531.1 ABC transporter permease [Cryobacterium sp. TMS1-20-1]